MVEHLRGLLKKIWSFGWPMLVLPLQFV